MNARHYVKKFDSCIGKLEEKLLKSTPGDIGQEQQFMKIGVK